MTILTNLSYRYFFWSLKKILPPANCPEINVTEDASKRDPDFRPQAHCPLNSVTEQASLKSLKSQGVDLVEGPSKCNYDQAMSKRY